MINSNTENRDILHQSLCSVRWFKAYCKKTTHAIPLDVLVSGYLLHLITLFPQSTSRIKENFTPRTVVFSLAFWMGRAALCILELQKSGYGRKSFLHWCWYEQGEPLEIPGFCSGEDVPD